MLSGRELPVLWESAESPVLAVLGDVPLPAFLVIDVDAVMNRGVEGKLPICPRVTIILVDPLQVILCV